MMIHLKSTSTVILRGCKMLWQCPQLVMVTLITSSPQKVAIHFLAYINIYVNSKCFYHTVQLSWDFRNPLNRNQESVNKFFFVLSICIRLRVST